MIELSHGWHRDFLGDVPELTDIGGSGRAIPQQVGLITPEGAPIQVSYDHAERLGFLVEGDDRWSLPIIEYLAQMDL